MIRITRRNAVALGSTTLLLPSALRAQSAWPTGPVTFVVGYAAGGSSDINARELAHIMSPVLGQQIIVDNKGGATGSIGLRAVANAKPDGYTLFFAVGTNVVINPHVQKGMIDTIASLAPICQTTSYQYVLAVNPKVPASTAAELVALAKKDPEKLTYSSSGVGGNNHLAGALFAETSGIQLTHVPYKGTAEWTQALLGGEVHFICDGAQWAPMVDSAKFRILAMATEQRIAKYMDVPTLRERGIDVVGQSPYGLVGPKDLPPNIVEAVHLAFKAAMADPRVDALLDSYIQAPWYKSPTEYRAFAEKYFVEVKPLLIKAGLAKA